MLAILKFVQGAVAKKDFVPALTHFRIENGLIKGYNGALGLCSPIPLDLTISPKAAPFIKAIQACKETVAMSVTPNGKLSIKSGKFKAYIDCLDEPFPTLEPQGEIIPLTDSFLSAVKKVAPFIAEDASRPWARGILFNGQSIYATNNIVAIEYWLGFVFPVVLNIPQAAIKELLRIGEDPISLQVTDTTMTFHYLDGRWIRSQCLDLAWPDLAPIFGRESTPAPISPVFFSEVESLMPFLDDLGRVYFFGNRLCTHEADSEGATTETETGFPLPEKACFNGKQLLLLEKVATEVDFFQYPDPCMFFGESVRGAIVGVRL